MNSITSVFQLVSLSNVNSKYFSVTMVLIYLVLFHVKISRGSKCSKVAGACVCVCMYGGGECVGRWGQELGTVLSQVDW